MIKENYHTHTSRCGHAIGTDEEYVLEAIAFGITELGFSDHIFLPYHSQLGIRGEYEELEDYISSIEALKEKYKDRINIHLGFEAEAMKEYFPYYKQILGEGHIEYLVLGNHCEVDKKNKENLHFYFSHATKAKDIIRYTNSLVKGIKSGLFRIVAHPDYFMGSYYKWNKTTISCAKKICYAAKKHNVYLEFNFGAVRRGKKLYGKEYRFAYPYNKFWEIAKKYKCKVMIGLDAHTPTDISTLNNDGGYEFFKELGLELNQKMTFK